jgi:hypothetical protein
MLEKVYLLTFTSVHPCHTLGVRGGFYTPHQFLLRFLDPFDSQDWQECSHTPSPPLPRFCTNWLPGLSETEHSHKSGTAEFYSQIVMKDRSLGSTASQSP